MAPIPVLPSDADGHQADLDHGDLGGHSPPVCSPIMRVTLMSSGFPG